MKERKSIPLADALMTISSMTEQSVFHSSPIEPDWSTRKTKSTCVKFTVYVGQEVMHSPLKYPRPAHVRLQSWIVVVVVEVVDDDVVTPGMVVVDENAGSQVE